MAVLYHHKWQQLKTPSYHCLVHFVHHVVRLLQVWMILYTCHRCLFLCFFWKIVPARYVACAFFNGQMHCQFFPSYTQFSKRLRALLLAADSMSVVASLAISHSLLGVLVAINVEGGDKFMVDMSSKTAEFSSLSLCVFFGKQGQGKLWTKICPSTCFSMYYTYTASLWGGGQGQYPNDCWLPAKWWQKWWDHLRKIST